MNHDLEKELNRALRRHQPSDDFAARVMAQLGEVAPVKQAATVSWWQRLAALFVRPQLRWATAGALACLLAVVGTLRYREHQRIEAERSALEQAAEEAEGQRAKEQVIFALQIASAKLNVAQRKVRESSERGAELR